MKKSKIEVVIYRTLTEFVKACLANGISLVKVNSRMVGQVSGKWMQYRDEITVTACSRKSPVLRVWKTDKWTKDRVVTTLEIENFYLSDGEWTVGLLEEFFHE